MLQDNGAGPFRARRVLAVVSHKRAVPLSGALRSWRTLAPATSEARRHHALFGPVSQQPSRALASVARCATPACLILRQRVTNSTLTSPSTGSTPSRRYRTSWLLAPWRADIDALDGLPRMTRRVTVSFFLPGIVEGEVVRARHLVRRLRAVSGLVDEP